MKIAARCPTCGEPGTMRRWDGQIRRFGVELSVSGRRCSACAEMLFDVAEMQRQERVVAMALAERDALTGAEFRLIRRVLGLTIAQLTAMWGIATDVIVWWEARPTRTVPSPAAYVIGALLIRPRTRSRVVKFMRAD